MRLPQGRETPKELDILLLFRSFLRSLLANGSTGATGSMNWLRCRDATDFEKDVR
jgi:hypothetical protein